MPREILQVDGELTVMWWERSSLSAASTVLYVSLKPQRQCDLSLRACTAQPGWRSISALSAAAAGLRLGLAVWLPGALLAGWLTARPHQCSPQGTCLVASQMRPAPLRNCSAAPQLILQRPLPAADCHA